MDSFFQPRGNHEDHTFHKLRFFNNNLKNDPNDLNLVRYERTPAID